MSDSCIVTPGVRNSKGEIVDSRLFKSLLSFFDGDRKQAFYHYKIATDKGFLDAHNDGEWVFDDLGEINLQQYAQFISLEKPDFPTQKALESELKSKEGKYGFQEAVEKMEAFNRKQHKNSRFIAAIRQDKKTPAFFEVYIAPNDKATHEQIDKVIHGRNLTDRLIALLAKHGVSVEFIRGQSRYTTENIEQAADGLYSFIKWKETGDIGEYAEQAGHFVIGALGDHQLAQRLQDLLDKEDTRNSILRSMGVDPESVNLGSNPSQTVAGMLVGKALERKLSHNIFRKLADRLINVFNNLIKNISRSDVVKAKAEARILTDKAASIFKRGDLHDEGALTALKTSETRWSKTKEAAKKDVSLSLNDLEALRREIAALEDTDTSVSTQIQEIISRTGEAMPNEKLIILYPQALLNMVDGMVNILDSIQPDNSAPISENTPLIELEGYLKESSSRLIKYTFCARTAQDMLEVLKLYDSKIKEVLRSSPEGQQAVQKYLDLKSSLEKHVNDVFNSTSSAYLNEARNISAAYLSALYGDRFVAYNEGLLWNGSKGKHITFTFGSDPSSEHPNKIDITQYVYEDDGPLQRFMGSLVNSKDIGAQLIVRAIKASKRKAETRMGECFSELMALDDKAKKAGIRDYQRFYERNEKGELTGNLKWLHLNPDGKYVELNWDQYENDRQAIHEEVYDEFVHSTEFEIYKNASAAVKQVILHDYFDSHPKLIAWHEQHSLYSEEHNQHIPNPTKYQKSLSLSDAEIQWYQEYQQTFKRYKDLLGGKKMAIQLAPQTRGSFWTNMKNLKDYTLGAGIRAIGRSVWASIASVWEQDSSMVNEASHYNWNTEEETILDSYINAKNQINMGTSRILPVYHNRKLKDLQRLDTNLIAATMKFAAMAAQYNASKDVQDALEITVQQLESRTVYETDDDKEREISARSSSRKVRKRAKVNESIREYVDAHFYGLNYGIFHKLRDLTHNKLAQGIATIGGKAMVAWYLGGNIMSAGANLITGFLEITKDAIVGSEFNLLDYARANAIYALQLPAFLCDALLADNKVASINLFNQQFNALDKSREYYVNYRTWGERFAQRLNPLSIYMSGYSITEHYMQSVPYLAMAMHTKLYTEGGEKTDLWKELQRRKDIYGDTTINREVLTLTRTVFDSKKKLIKYNHAKQLIEVFKQARDERKTGLTKFFKEIQRENGDAYKYLKEVMHDEGILESYFEEGTMSYDDFINLLETRRVNLTYNQDNLREFGLKAREATNRLHGVYNREDKSAFNRTLIGMLLLPFKGYAFGMLQKRFGGRHYNVTLGRESEGYFNSSAKGLISTGKDIKDIATGLINYIGSSSQEDKDFYRMMTTEAIRHLPYLALSVLSHNKDVLSKAGLNKTQAENFRHTILATTLLVAMGAFILYAAALAGGTEDDDELEAMLGKDKDGNVKDGHKAYSNVVQYINKMADERGYKVYQGSDVVEDYDQIDGYYIDLSKPTRKKVLDKVALKAIASGKDPEDVLNGLLADYLVKEVKRVNRKWAFYNRPYWNLANAFGHRAYSEQLAFNSYSGLKKEGLGLMDFMPLSIKAMCEIAEMADMIRVSKKFEKSTTDLSEIPLAQNSKKGFVMSNFYSNYINILTGKEPNADTKPTIEELIDIIQMPAANIKHVLQNYADSNTDQKKISDALGFILGQTYGITNFQSDLRKQVKKQFKELYPNKKFEDYFYTRGKKGYNEIFDSKSETLLEYKLNPMSRLEYVKSNSNQYIRDMFFGQKEKKKK